MYVHSSLYISSIMRTLQSDDHIQDPYVLFLRLIDPESDGAAVSSLDGLNCCCCCCCRFFNFLFCFVLLRFGLVMDSPPV